MTIHFESLIEASNISETTRHRSQVVNSEDPLLLSLFWKILKVDFFLVKIGVYRSRKEVSEKLLKQ